MSSFPSRYWDSLVYVSFPFRRLCARTVDPSHAQLGPSIARVGRGKDAKAMKRNFRCDGSIVPPLSWTMESHGCHSCWLRSRVVTLVVSVSSLEWFFSFLWLRFEWIVGAGFPALSSRSLSCWDAFPIDPFGRPWLGPFHHPGNVLANPSMDGCPPIPVPHPRACAFPLLFLS